MPNLLRPPARHQRLLPAPLRLRAWVVIPAADDVPPHVDATHQSGGHRPRLRLHGGGAFRRVARACAGAAPRPCAPHWMRSRDASVESPKAVPSSVFRRLQRLTPHQARGPAHFARRRPPLEAEPFAPVEFLPELRRPSASALLLLSVASLHGENAVPRLCTNEQPRHCGRIFPQRRRLRRPPLRRGSSETIRQVWLPGPRWCAPGECVPEFAANFPWHAIVSMVKQACQRKRSIRPRRR
jgi:hypothetical protein